MKVNFRCWFCKSKHEIDVIVPDGWLVDDVETNGLCSDHAIIDYFISNQCPGCVGGWGDCALWESFAYDKNKLTAKDFEQIKKGFCPKRTNGSFVFEGGAFSEKDMSDQAPYPSGRALANAIKYYLKTYSDIDVEI